MFKMLTPPTCSPEAFQRSLAARLLQDLGGGICLLPDFPCVCACVYIGEGMGSSERLLVGQCLALRLVVLGMGTFRDEAQIFGPTNWDLVGKYAATIGT